MIPVYKPYFPKGSFKYAHEALRSTWVSSQGKFIRKCEAWLEEALGVKHVLLTSNGTTAMHLVAKSLKYMYPYLEGILVPNNVYVAAWNAFLYDKEFTLYPIDANISTWNVDLRKLVDSSDKALAVLFVHNLGNTINVPGLRRFLPEHVFVEDACESFGGTYHRAIFHAGTASLCSGMSFFGNKNVTSGEGGAFLTNDGEVYRYAKKLWGQGSSDKKFIHDILGYNYRMTNVAAAILYGQLLIATDIMEMKIKVFEAYIKAFENIDTISLSRTDQESTHSLWMCGIRIPDSPGYDQAKTYFDAVGIDTRPMFYPITYHKYLESYDCDITVAETLSKECIILPSYPGLAIEEDNQKHIIEQVIKYSRKGWENV